MLLKIQGKILKIDIKYMLKNVVLLNFILLRCKKCYTRKKKEINRIKYEIRIYIKKKKTILKETKKVVEKYNVYV